MKTLTFIAIKKNIIYTLQIMMGLYLSASLSCASPPVVSNEKANVLKCSIEKQEKLLNGDCIHVCTGPKIEAMSGKVCPNGRPGMALEVYNSQIKIKR